MMENSKSLESHILELRQRIRHSAAHLMADAVTQLFPEAKLGIGPPTEDGFYYDLDVPRPFTPEDLDQVATIMEQTIAKDLPFVMEEHAREDIIRRCKDQPYKLELIDEIPEDETITTYSHDKFSDLCQGPHVSSTGEVPAFKLLSVAGAYWRGSENRPMLQRIYGTAFESQDALDLYLERLREAEKRDHRKVGRELDLFSIHEETGPGLIVWHPKGARLRGIIEDIWKQKHYSNGYDLVYTPHIGRSTLWETSGHLDFYKENMYASMDLDGQEYYLKPMNCPFHIMFYKTRLRSYRDLPIRVGELGSVYRYERAGVLHGLMRVRGMTQDDAHIFCRPDQVELEINRVLNLTFSLLESFGFTDFDINLSTRPEKAVGRTNQWDLATKSLSETLKSRGLSFDIDEGGGAFYGPKIDIHIRDAIGRKWQCTTIQFDFNLPERFNLHYVGEDGQDHQPYMIHRALLGSIERFIGVLIEHYGGAFPFWLSPVQALIIPIADRHIPYAQELRTNLDQQGFRVTVDSRNERMNLKIREAQLQKTPYMLVVGDREVTDSTASVRSRDEGNLDAIPIKDIATLFKEKVIRQ